MTKARYEVHAPWAFIDNKLIWGWVPFNRWNPVHWFLKRREVTI